ncbi:MAG TPA: hypothetical protein O0X23_05110 [Methanocorpusculum sp.]|nr:hypothetical protein [Methanocorpusculum sp.]
MNICDVTLTLGPGIYVYPGDPEFVWVPLRSGGSYISALALRDTHWVRIDAHAHHFPEVAWVDKLPLERLFTTAELLSFGGLVSETTSAVLFRSGYREGDTTHPQFFGEGASPLCGMEWRLSGVIRRRSEAIRFTASCLQLAWW